MMKLLALLLLFGLTLAMSGKTVAAEPNAANTVVMETTLGEIEIELFAAEAPLTVANFRQYVADGFYDGLIFHRVIPGFVIQGGGMEPGMEQRANRAPIKNEAANGRKNLRGTLSMARTGVVDSATSQFFINLADNPALDHRGQNPAMYGYAVFGRVVRGMEVVDAVAAQPTTSKGFSQDVPVEDVVIIRAVNQ